MTDPKWLWRWGFVCLAAAFLLPVLARVGLAVGEPVLLFSLGVGLLALTAFLVHGYLLQIQTVLATLQVMLEEDEND